MAVHEELPVVVVGAGPVGLAAAAHLLERGIEPLVLEAGASAGSAVAAWGHVRLFSPWRYDVDAAARRLLEATGWTAPDPDALPTGAELVERYLTPLAATPQIAARLRTSSRVVAISREGADKTRSLGRERLAYRVRVQGPDGATHHVRARAVLDASGTWGQPNPVGTGGLPAFGEVGSSVVTGPLPDVLGTDRALFAGRRTLVVGMGHSAANTLLSLVELARDEPGTRIAWAVRGGSPRRLYGGGTDDELPARGLLGTRLRDAVESGLVTLATRTSIERIEPVGPSGGTWDVGAAGTSDVPTAPGPVRVQGTTRDGELDLEVDTVVGATGFRPDLDMLREVRLDLDPVVESPRALADLIDPNHHSCGTVPPHGEALLAHPDTGFYVVGMKSYGRAPTFLLATGYEQVRSIAAALAGDREAADLVQLDLPATGVCSSDLALDPVSGEVAEVSCCGTSPAAAEPVLVTFGAPAGSLGFATGTAHGRSADEQEDPR
ncbi:FAD-dependent oxidoreductase [Oerskovia enterophila]